MATTKKPAAAPKKLVRKKSISTSQIFSTIRLGPEFLSGDKYKMLTEEGKQKISEHNDNVKEETVIELPDGLLFLNLMESDIDKWNENILIKVPPSILGYMPDLPGRRFLLPSFLEGTNISENGCKRDYYDCELPQRACRILGRASNGSQLMYKSVEDEDEARRLTEDEFYNLHDHCYAAIPTSGEYSGSDCWKLVFDRLELGLYSDDALSDICVDVGDSDETVILIHTFGGSFEEENDRCTAVMVRDVEDGSVSDDEAICTDVYDPRLLKKLGCNDINDGVWSLRYDERDVDWTDSCFGDPRFYYCENEEYSELDQLDQLRFAEKVGSSCNLVLIMTVDELEHELSVNGWYWRCWEDIWEKDGREISFPELNMFKDDFKVILVSNVKVLYKDESGDGRIVTETELNDIV